MNQKELLMYHELACEKMKELVKLKNTNYSGNQVSTDAFVNFKRSEALGICSVEQGMLVRITDKLGRIISFVEKDYLIASDESVQDTILDAANYLLILGAYIKSKNVKNLSDFINSEDSIEEDKEDYDLQLKNMVEVFNKETEIRTEPAKQVAAVFEKVTEQFKTDAPIIEVPNALKGVLEKAENELLPQLSVPLPIKDVSFVVEDKEADIHIRTFVKDSSTTPIDGDLSPEGYSEPWFVGDGSLD